MTRPAIKRIGKGSGVPKLTPAQERARRSVAEFRKLLPTLTAYARNLTGKKNVKVVMDAHTNGRTDGKSIFMRPPLALGDLEAMRHEKAVCDRRDPVTYAQLCSACETRELILATVYHEIAHIAFDTFLAVGNDDIEGAIEMIRQSAPEWYYEAVKERLAVAKYRMQVNEFIKLAMVVNPYLNTLVNGLEDSRINERMAQARPGTRIMQQAKTYKVAYGGVEQKDERTGEVIRVRWSDYDLNMQASIGLFCVASGYRIDGWFNERVETALKDEHIQNLCKDVPALPTAKSVFGRSFEIFLRMRELGFFVTKDEELPPPPPPEPEESDDEDVERESSDTDDSESGSEDGQDRPDGNGPGADDSNDPEGSGEKPAEESESDSGGASGREDAGSDAGDEGDRRTDDAGDSETDDNAEGEPGEFTGDGTGSDDRPDERSASFGDDDGNPEAGGGEDPDEHGEADSRGEDQSPAGEDASGSDDGMEEEAAEASDQHGDSGDSDPGDAEAGPSSGDGEAGEPGEAGDQPGSGDGDGPDSDGNNELGDPGDDSTGESSSRGSDSKSESDGQADGDGSEAGDGSSDSEVDSDAAADESRGGPEQGEGTPEGGSGSESGGPREGEGAPGNDDSGADGQGRGEATEDSEPHPDPLGTGTDASESEGGEELHAGNVPGKADHRGADQAGGPDAGPEDGSEEYVDPLDYQPDSDRAVDATEREGEREIVPPTIDSDTKIELVDMGLHDEHADPSTTEEAEIESAIVQGLYFEMPSSHVGGLRVWRYAEREADAAERIWHAWGSAFDGYYGGQSKADIDPVGEQHLGPALMKLRVAFSDNRRTRHNRNQRAGRIDTRALGKRAWGNDDRLFGRKVIPGKKDYFVVIGLDVSGSTRGVNLKMIKEAALAQAELCQRLGVKFAVYAHTGSPLSVEHLDNRYVDIYEIKSPDQPWDGTTRAALMEIGPSAANLDGHTLEFYRKVCDGEKATNKVILYYSDGAMPLENYTEELEILQREIATCRQKKITLLGVGVRTDSPTKHGLDTVQIDDSNEVGKVVAHLERALIP